MCDTLRGKRTHTQMRCSCFESSASDDHTSTQQLTEGFFLKPPQHSVTKTD